jgi:hypothetical protein
VRRQTRGTTALKEEGSALTHNGSRKLFSTLEGEFPIALMYATKKAAEAEQGR